MATGNLKVILQLEGAEVPLAEDGQFVLHRAEGPLEAAALLARFRPGMLLIRADLAWHRSFVRALPKASRPAIVAVGSPRPVVEALVPAAA